MSPALTVPRIVDEYSDCASVPVCPQQFALLWALDEKSMSAGEPCRESWDVLNLNQSAPRLFLTELFDLLASRLSNFHRRLQGQVLAW